MSDDELVTKIALVTLLTVAGWTVLFWRVPIRDIVKCVISGHMMMGAFFITASAVVSYGFGVPLPNGEHLFACTAACALIVGAYLQSRRRK
jgi:hypothetical protein